MVDDSAMGSKASMFIENARVLNPNIDVTNKGVVCRVCIRNVESTAEKVIILSSRVLKTRTN